MSVENDIKIKKNSVYGSIRVETIDPNQDVFITGDTAVIGFGRCDGLSIHIAENQVDNLIDWAFAIQRAFAKKRNQVPTDTETSIWDV